MLNKAIIKYFKDVNIFNFLFSLIIGVASGFFWGVVSFVSFGFVIGLLGFHFFKKNEYYAYYNLGFTKLNLVKKVWLLNISIAVVFFLCYILFK